MKIAHVAAREILDSKGTPTIAVEVELADGMRALASIPSGASTGSHETVELRDNDPNRYAGKGVLQAVKNVQGPLAAAIKDVDALDQAAVDAALIAVDGTPDKSQFGGNAILGISLAVARAAAASTQTELFHYIQQTYQRQTGTVSKLTLPQPMMLMLEGGKHGNWATDIQEFMIVPKKEVFPTVTEQIRVGADVFRNLEKILEHLHYSTGVGFEGAFAPQELSNNEEAFQLISQAISTAGYTIGTEIVLAIDAASSEFYVDSAYQLKSEQDVLLSPEQWQQRLLKWQEQYHIWSIEDPFSEEAWADWTKYCQQVGAGHQVVGDDLLTTNVNLIQKAINQRAVNAVLIKPNQIGTLTETLQAIKVARDEGWGNIISHRSGETSDEFIADLAVGTGAGQCKFGGPNRGERVAKYNRLMQIEALLNNN